MMQPSRFWSKVDVSGGPEACWMWTRATDHHGYGRYGLDYSWTYAHRYAYELLVGPISAGLVIDHLCRTPGCVNPLHLEAVTQRENVLRSPLGAGAKARRTHCPAGHEYTPDNTMVSPKRQRKCRTCDRDRHRARYQSRREAARASGG